MRTTVLFLDITHDQEHIMNTKNTLGMMYHALLVWCITHSWYDVITKNSTSISPSLCQLPLPQIRNAAIEVPCQLHIYIEIWPNHCLHLKQQWSATRDSRTVPLSTSKYHSVLQSTPQYFKVPLSTSKYPSVPLKVPLSTAKYSLCAVKYPSVLWITPGTSSATMLDANRLQAHQGTYACTGSRVVHLIRIQFWQNVAFFVCPLWYH